MKITFTRAIASTSTIIVKTTALLLSFSGSAQAAVIDFETLPDSTTTPTDNAALTTSYTVDGTTVTFGFDTNNDLIIDTNAIFESRNDGPETVFAYYHKGGYDTDVTATNEGGNWLLRSLKNINPIADDFIVKYTGTPITSTSGQLWDIDSGEIYLIEALDSAGTVINSITTPPFPVGESPESPNTFSGLPYNFSFNNLASDIGYIRISGISRGTGGFLGFDNFNVTQSEPVPEPLTILGSATALGFGGLLKRVHSKNINNLSAGLGFLGIIGNQPFSQVIWSQESETALDGVSLDNSFGEIWGLRRLSLAGNLAEDIPESKVEDIPEPKFVLSLLVLGFFFIVKKR